MVKSMSDIKSVDEIKDVWSRLTSTAAAGTSEQLQTALTFDDISSFPNTQRSCRVRWTSTRLTKHPAERAQERRNGHGDRSALAIAMAQHGGLA